MLSRPLSAVLLVGALFGATQTVPALAQAGTERAHLNLEKGIALSGYDPVSYFSGKPAKGFEGISAEHGGAKYLFATDEHRKTFKANPVKFLPAYGGWCAYAMADGKKVEVDPMNYQIKDGRLFLFFKSRIWGDTLPKWNKDEARLFPAAESHWDQTIKGH